MLWLHRVGCNVRSDISLAAALKPKKNMDTGSKNLKKSASRRVRWTFYIQHMILKGWGKKNFFYCAITLEIVWLFHIHGSQLLKRFFKERKVYTTQTFFLKRLSLTAKKGLQESSNTVDCEFLSLISHGTSLGRPRARLLATQKTSSWT